VALPILEPCRCAGETGQHQLVGADEAIDENEDVTSRRLRAELTQLRQRGGCWCMRKANVRKETSETPLVGRCRRVRED
jgi:hypothetical protein